jgi:hypothetical protein
MAIAGQGSVYATKAGQEQIVRRQESPHVALYSTLQLRLCVMQVVSAPWRHAPTSSSFPHNFPP